MQDNNKDTDDIIDNFIEENKEALQKLAAENNKIVGAIEKATKKYDKALKDLDD